MTGEEKDLAKNALLGIYQRLQQAKAGDRTSVEDEVLPGDDPVEDCETETVDDFEAYLDSLQDSETIASSTSSTASQVTASSDFTAALLEVERLGRQKLPNVWDIIKSYPEIVQPVARVVSCLPSTQVSVERMFSHLKLVLRDNRARMGNDLTEAIVFLRTNKCV